jgi:hypothetical protein
VFPEGSNQEAFMTFSYVRRFALAGLAVASLAAPAAAQLSDNLGALSGDNARRYLQPLSSGLSGTLNASIFPDGKIPIAGLSLNIGVRLMGISFDDKDRLFTPTDPPGFTSTASVQAPTVIGPTQAVAQPGAGGTTLYYPGGFDIQNFAVAVPQLTIGSVFGTRAVVRWIAVDLGDAEIGHLSLFGIGAQHSISRYIPVLPVDLAAGVFYQSFNLGDDLVDAATVHYGLTASKSFGLFTPYATVGLDRFDMKAKYESSSTGETINVDFDTESNGHFSAGGVFSLGVVRLYGELCVAAETGMAAGLSFGLGN